MKAAPRRVLANASRLCYNYNMPSFPKVTFFFHAVVAAAALLCAGCSAGSTSRAMTANSKTYLKTQNNLQKILQNESLSQETRYAVVNQIASNMRAVKDYNSLVLFLTGWVESHRDDQYNAYWLLMAADAYLENDAEPVAEYYLERIIKNYGDLMVKGKSVHFLCLQHLIQISENPTNRIAYFNQLISRFPDQVNITELYYRLALEYEKLGDWTQALKTFTLFLNREDAPTLQLQDIPNAYLTARQLVDFGNSSKNWTFETLEELVSAVQGAISSYDYKKLDSYKSKVNFFAMSWRQDESDAKAQDSFSMRSYMRGNRIRYEKELDPISSPTSAYLRTWGWSSYLNVWYFYFRKVNFPVDPDIHGRWEWAGIYYGEKL